MPALRLYISNRLEILAGNLAEVLRTPLTSPLDNEVILVQSRGMERWVSMQLARHHGICANCAFPFPNHFVQDLFRIVLPEFSKAPAFERETLAWRIMRLLPSCSRKRGFESVRNYMGDAKTDLKRFQLSEKIADMFDQYLLFRPEMVFRWESGAEKHWQAELWRELVKEGGRGHRASLGKTLLRKLGHAQTIEGLPERISVFGISALPGFYLEVLAALAKHIRVGVFLMNPCREYWGDIVSDRGLKRVSVGPAKDAPATEALYLEKGNSLLASMGTLGRDFFDLIAEFPCEEYASFVAPGKGTLLSMIQADILDLVDRPIGAERRNDVSPEDKSVQIHSCHSPMREMEVLQDQLLDLFERKPDLNPRDIVVMTPDIEVYAPYIQAVFDLPPEDPRRIPFSIADRAVKKEGELIDAFLRALRLTGSRLGASEVLTLLESPSIRRTFGLLEEDLLLIRRWIRETGIRWGFDSESRVRLGLPPMRENSWAAGLESLLMGYAMPGRGEALFKGILPFDHMEGSDTLVLGNFVEFAERLFGHITSFEHPRALSSWSLSLTDFLANIFTPDENTEREVEMLRRALNDMLNMEAQADFHDTVDIGVIRWHLEHNLGGRGFGFGFLTGGVSFCAMLPMRSIPFKVICLVGMNGNAYPRQSKPLGFDLIARHPKKGDRTRRNDDRYLFLEAILSAREALYISYVGQDIQDNTSLPASVLVSELMDYVEQGFRVAGKPISEHVITNHRLQAFNSSYFAEDGPFFSYSHANCRAAQRLVDSRQHAVPFISEGLPEPDDTWKTVDLNDLCAFFSNPARFLLRRRLNIYLEEKEPILEEREPFEVRGLEKFLMEQQILEWKFAGKDLIALLARQKASGKLPHGTVGACVFEEMRYGVEIFFEKTAPFLCGAPLEPLEILIPLADFTLVGTIGDLYAERLTRYRYAKVKARDMLDLWIHHLALNSVSADRYPRRSMLLGLDRPGREESKVHRLEFPPLDNSREILKGLMHIFWRGLTRPLPFFPESSRVVAHEMAFKNKPEQDAFQKAGNVWIGSEYVPGECEDGYYHVCFRNRDPLDAQFRQLALDVFEPIMEHLQETPL